MNRDVLEGDWRQLKGRAKEQWGKLTDDDLLQIDGQFDQLAGKIQEAYGFDSEEAKRQVRDWNGRHLLGR